MRTIRILLLSLLLVGLVAPAAPADQLAAEPASETDNLEHITNVEYDRVRGSSWWATDSDFTTFEIPEGWTLPEDTNIGSIEIPADYAPEEGEVRTFNLMGSHTNGMWITDITDPEDPVVVSRWDCGVTQADVFVFEQDEATYAAYTLDATASMVADSDCASDLGLRGQASAEKGTFIADVTDPYRPITVSFLPMRKGTHQVTVHPSGNYVYNSAAVLVTDYLGTIEVYDVANPAEPELVSELELVTGLDSHDMTFSEDGERLYVAALTHSLIIDTSDPANPEVISRIFDPAINIHHDAHAVSVDTPLGERTFLLLGDELGGATPAGFCPGGGIHVYDITGPLEMAPLKVGAFFIPEVRLTPLDTGGLETCTAHVIQPLPGTTLLSVAWYNAGVRILDYAGLADLGPAGLSVGLEGNTLTPGIQEVAHSRFADSSLWSAKVHEVNEDGSFYIFGGDMSRHLDVWKFTPDAEGSASSEQPEPDPGTWLSAQETLERAAGITVPAGYTPLCLLPKG